MLVKPHFLRVLSCELRGCALWFVQVCAGVGSFHKLSIFFPLVRPMRASLFLPVHPLPWIKLSFPFLLASKNPAHWKMRFTFCLLFLFCFYDVTTLPTTAARLPSTNRWKSVLSASRRCWMKRTARNTGLQNAVERLTERFSYGNQAGGKLAPPVHIRL